MRNQRGSFGESYRVLGTKDGATTCHLCGRTGLTYVKVLEVYDEDGQPIGNKYACEGCAASVASRTLK